jgi:hypothetical protein
MCGITIKEMNEAAERIGQDIESGELEPTDENLKARAEAAFQKKCPNKFSSAGEKASSCVIVNVSMRMPPPLFTSISIQFATDPLVRNDVGFRISAAMQALAAGLYRPHSFV